MTIETTTTILSHEYTITLDGDTVDISRDGHWSCSGRWNADRDEIIDCTADLGDEVYAALDEAIADAILDAAEDETLHCTECGAAFPLTTAEYADVYIDGSACPRCDSGTLCR